MEPQFETELCDLKIEGGHADGERRPLPVLQEDTGEEERLRVEDTEKVIEPLDVRHPHTQESMATDEGFHDESANDTEPLVSSNC